MKMLMITKDSKGMAEIPTSHMEHKYIKEHRKLFEDVAGVMENHPKTWERYKGSSEEFDEIANMEIRELIEAKEHHEFWDLYEEYVHCAAAFLCAAKYIHMHNHKEK